MGMERYASSEALLCPVKDIRRVNVLRLPEVAFCLPSSGMVNGL
jgi:hypothetical protein